MTGIAGRRWPLEPLLTYCRMTPSGFARTHGLRAGSLYAAVESGLNDRQADEWALAADLHPANVWGQEWLDAASGLDAEHLGDAA